MKWEEAHNLVDPFHLKMEAQPLPKRRIFLKIKDKLQKKEKIVSIICVPSSEPYRAEGRSVSVVAVSVPGIALGSTLATLSTCPTNPPNFMVYLSPEKHNSN